MKHVDPKSLVPASLVPATAPPPHPLEAWARRIERARNFDISSGQSCAVWHARDMGLLRKLPNARWGDPTAKHIPSCACSTCCDWQGLADQCGVHCVVIHDVWSGNLGRTREEVAGTLRSYLPGGKPKRSRLGETATQIREEMTMRTALLRELADITRVQIPTMIVAGGHTFRSVQPTFAKGGRVRTRELVDA